MLHFAALLLTIALLFGIGSLALRSSVQVARSVWLVAFVMVISCGVTMMIAHAFAARWGIRTDASRDGLWTLMDGTAWRPFVYRRLAPDIVRLSTGFIEQHVPNGPVDNFLRSSTLLTVVEHVHTRHESIAAHVAYGMVWLAWFGTVIVAAALLRAVRACTWLEALVSATLAICLVPTTLVHGGYIYDSTELLLWTTLILCLWQGWYFALPVVFAALLFNKETVLATVPALYPLLRRRLSLRQAGGAAALLGLVAVAWTLFIRQRYAAMPGATQEWHLASNIRFWIKPSSYLSLAAVFSPGLLAPRGANAALILLMLIPLRFGWPHVARELKLSTILVALFMVPLFLLSGLTDETRALGTLFPFLFLIASEGLRQLFTPSTEAVTPL